MYGSQFVLKKHSQLLNKGHAMEEAIIHMVLVQKKGITRIMMSMDSSPTTVCTGHYCNSF